MKDRRGLQLAMASAHVLFVGSAAPTATARDARGQVDLAQPSAATKAR
jgi:hypothetical protein